MKTFEIFTGVYRGLPYSVDWTHGLDLRTGFMLMCGQEEQRIIMWTVISILAQQN